MKRLFLFLEDEPRLAIGLPVALAMALLGCFDNPAIVDRVERSSLRASHRVAQTKTCPARSCQHAGAFKAGHGTGRCGPTKQICSNVPATDGTSCNDNNACTTGDVLLGGACEGLIPCSGEMLTRGQQTVNPSLYLRYLWGSGPNDIYATGYYAKYVHLTGQGPFPTRTLCNAGSHLGKIWGSSATDVYTVSLNKVLHSVGSDIWETEDTDDDEDPGILHSIWGSSSTDIYAVDYYSGKIFHSAGDKQWALDPSPTEGLIIEALRGSGAGDVYAVGYDPNHSSSGFIIHRGPDGVWTLVADETSVPELSMRPLQNIWANSPSDVYVVGNDGLILHSTGNGAWTVQQSNSINNVTSIWAPPSGTPVFVTTGPRILKSDGARPDGTGTWTPLPSGAPFPINDIWGDSATSLWVVSLSATEEIHLTHVTLDGNACDGGADGDPCRARPAI